MLYLKRNNSSYEVTKNDSIKDFGIYLSSNLTFTQHHDIAAEKGYAVVNMLRRTFPRITKADFKFLFSTYVRPILEYASQVVTTGLAKDANIVEKVQRRATKMVTGLYNVPYETRLQVLNLYPLDCRRLRGDLIFTYVQFSQKKEDEIFQTAGPSNLRGHERKLFKRHARTSLRLNFFPLEWSQPGIAYLQA